MIFQLDDSKPSDKGFAITLTIVVILTNTFLLICFVIQFIRAKIHERKEAARLTTSKPKLKKNFFLRASFSALRQRFGSSGGEVELTSFENPLQDKDGKNSSKKKRRLSSRELMSQMSSQQGEGEVKRKDGEDGEDGDGLEEGEAEGEGEGEGEVIVTLGINPMHAASNAAPEAATPNVARTRWNTLKHATRASRMFRNGGKQRMKRLSKVMKARHNESDGGGGGDSMGGEGEEMKIESDVETVVSMHVDEETGQRYSYDEATGQTQWLSDDDDESEATYMYEEAGESKQKPKTLFRKFVDDDDDAYYENVETGKVVWDLPKDGELVEL
jgi:hypothetical protein